MGKSKNRIEWSDMAEIPFRASRLFRALSNPKAYSLCRLLLERGSMEVGEMVTALDRSQPAVSRILRGLRDLNVVRYQKSGKATVYKIKHPGKLRSILDRGEAYIRHAEEDLERAR